MQRTQKTHDFDFESGHWGGRHLPDDLWELDDEPEPEAGDFWFDPDDDED